MDMKNFTIEINNDECLAGNMIEIIRRFDPTLQFSAELFEGYGIVITVAVTAQTKGSLKKIRSQFIDLYMDETCLLIIETDDQIQLEDSMVKITSIKAKIRSRPNRRTTKNVTILRLTDDLKQRVQELAKSQGITAHSLMIRAIENQVSSLEETAYLLESPSNACHLTDSIAQLVR